MNKSSFFLLSIFMLIVLATNAQQTEKAVSSTIEDGENMVKLNLTAIPLKNFSFQYERVVRRKMTVALGVRLMPNGGLPLKSTIKGFFDDDDDFKDQLDDAKLGSFAITPEVRFYMGKEAMRGFYLAPFARFATYNADLPIEYEYEDENGMTVSETIGLDGKITGLTAGLMAGAQWKLSKLVYLDWWILGLHYGSSDGEINGRKQLSPMEQDAIRDELEGLEDVPLVDVTTTVDGQGAKAKFSGPWGGIRAGLSIGFRF